MQPTCSFTPRLSIAADALPFLRTTVFEVGGYAMPLFKLLQHFSTLLGLSVLGVRAWRLQPLPAKRHGAVSNLARVGAALLLLTTSLVWAFANAAIHSAS